MVSGFSKIAELVNTRGTGSKEPAGQRRRYKRCGFEVGKIPWRRKWHPTPVSLPGKSHGQRSLVGDSLWGHKEPDTTAGPRHTGRVMIKTHLSEAQVSLPRKPTLSRKHKGILPDQQPYSYITTSCGMSIINNLQLSALGTPG